MTTPHPTQPKSTPSISRTQTSPQWGRTVWAAMLSILALGTLLVQGYHPLAEDGGLYVAGIEFTLDPSLFPHCTRFVREHLRFSIFAPLAAAVVRSTHLSLPWTLLLIDLFSIWLTLFAARQVLCRAIPKATAAAEAAQLAGVALLAAWWTLPVAGTSLLLMDPYVTARSLSTPLSLLAIAFALDEWTSHRLRSFLLCAICLAIAAALHPLMAAYALAFIIALRVSKLSKPLHRVLGWTILTAAAIALGALLQTFAPPESPAMQAAAITRYYWFLSQWQGYELLGLAGPLAVLALLLRFHRRYLTEAAAALCRTCLVLGAIVTLCALLFAHEAAPTHLVARLQVLRLYLLIYAVMALLLGAALFQRCDALRRSARAHAARASLLLAPAIFIAAMAATMAFVQRESFPASPHLELPWRTAENPNPWVRAFLWAKANTPRDALFALDAKYINTPGEDAQTFRATALRSALPDYSKDGGEASITPSLAQSWQQGAAAQQNLSNATDAVRDARLQPFGVTWMVLHSSAHTAHSCPYDNGTVKVCTLAPPTKLPSRMSRVPPISRTWRSGYDARTHKTVILVSLAERQFLFETEAVTARR